MLSLLAKLLLVCLAAWIIIALLHTPCAFEIRVSAGRPRVRRGKVTPAFLGTIADMCRRNRISDGWIRGHACGARTRLTFSGQFSDECRQQLRNDWQFFG
jgi:hypothetical protein